jgi:cytoskeletal protein RodZ
MKIDVDHNDEPAENPVPYQTPIEEPTSAPPVPRNIKSASPAMTEVKPEAPDPVEDVSRVNFEFEPDEAEQAPASEAPAERQERIDYLKNIRDDADRDRGAKGKKWYLIIPLILIILAALGIAGWYMKPLFMHKASPTPKPKVSQQTSNTPKTEPKDESNSTDFKEYTATNFPITLKYPSNWKPSETANEVDILSPKQALKNAAGSTAQGAVLLRIRHQQATLPEFKTGNAAAVLPSENIKYTSPAAGQRASTYLSFLQYAATTTKGGLDGLYITGNLGYQHAQAIPQTDVAKIDPLITVSFLDCTSTCTTASPALTVSSTIWTGDFQKIIETMLESLQISG